MPYAIDIPSFNAPIILTYYNYDGTLTFMAYNNPLMVELMVPRAIETSNRIHGFYESIGWDVWDKTDSEFDTYTAPDTGNFPAPTIAYWQTPNEIKRSHFTDNQTTIPSDYARGLSLPTLHDLVEVCLIVPSDEVVHNIFDRGGSLLRSHSFVLPREHAGRQEFRFSDPFNYALRVTANPGLEVNQSDEPLVGTIIEHSSGTTYEIDDVVLRAEGYESTGGLAREIIYTQLTHGRNPAGTVYSRSEEELLQGTTEGDSGTVPIFKMAE